MKKLTGGGRRRRCGILRVNCQTAAAAASGTVQISPSFCRCRERQKCYDLRAIHLDKTAILAPKRNLNFREGDFPGDIFVAPCVMFGCCSVAVRLPPSSPSGFWPDVHLFEARDGNCDFCPLSPSLLPLSLPSRSNTPAGPTHPTLSPHHPRTDRVWDVVSAGSRVARLPESVAR